MGRGGGRKREASVGRRGFLRRRPAGLAKGVTDVCTVLLILHMGYQKKILKINAMELQMSCGGQNGQGGKPWLGGTWRYAYGEFGGEGL